ncbi:uncharacterized protein ACRADG_010232 [Cochliomyia hominivorax]
MFLLFRKCCRILWKHISYQQLVTWLLLLAVLSQQQEIDCKPTKWNHSIQRRFMWKQMDSTVDGFVDRVVTGARVMKSMIGDFMPPKPVASNVMDYLPTETTRIRYIIRNPHTKETKVIRVRPSKKVVKLMGMTPKPLMVDKTKSMNMNEADHMTEKQKLVYMNDNEHITNKFNTIHMNDHANMKDKEKLIHMNEADHAKNNLKTFHIKYPEHITEKVNTILMINPEKLRQLEKEQELIAEGRLPMNNGAKSSFITLSAENSKDAKNVNIQFNTDDDIVSGKIKEFNESWKPVYKLGDTPAIFSTVKPYMMSALHTSVVGELLPKPQKQIYEPLTSNEFPEEDPKKSHTYEVTEYTAEESVIQPYTNEYHSQRNPTSSRVLSIKHSQRTTQSPNIVKQIEVETTAKPYYFDYQSQRGFLPSRGNFKVSVETSTTTTTPNTTSTSEEEPNYPAAYLKMIRNRPDSNYNSKVQHLTKSEETTVENNWIPSNATYSSQKHRQIPYHQHLTSVTTVQRTKSQKWPPDVQDTYFNSSQSYENSNPTTEIVVEQDASTHTSLSSSKSRKNVRLKNYHHSSITEPKHRSVRHRGSVKFGDKIEIEEH